MMRRLRATIERSLRPRAGWCYRCERPWRSGHVGVDEHITDYSTTQGCFPLCEGCWAELTPEDRLPYYDQLWLKWIELAWRDGYIEEGDYTAEKYEQIREAVLAGK